MKRRISIAVLLLCVFLLVCGFDEAEQKVFDDAGLLTESQEQELQEKAVTLAGQLQLDVVIVTTDDTEGKTSVEYADDFFDYNGFGYEKEMGSGILFLIDMDNRKSTISTSGTAIERYSDMEQDSWQDSLMVYLGDEDYYGACQEFLSGVKQYEAYTPPSANQGVTGPGMSVETGGEAEDSFSPENLLKRLAVSAVLGAVVVGIMVLSTQRMSGAGGRHYQSGKVNIRSQVDRFTHTTVMTRVIPKDTGASGGGSSSHSGSSGNSHGGSSRGF